VFVHGLQGHSKNTWTWRADGNKSKNSALIDSQQRRSRLKFWSRKVKSEDDPAILVERQPRTAVFWPQDLLPEECPNARILTWGYDSNVSNFFNGSASKNSILPHASDLLGDLNGAREFCVRSSLHFLLEAKRADDPRLIVSSPLWRIPLEVRSLDTFQLRCKC